MRASTFTFIATAASAAQIPFFVPAMTSDGIGVAPDASIMAADHSTTVMALACPTNVDETECGWGNKELVVSVVSATEYALEYANAGVRLECTSKGDMTCKVSIAQEFTDAGLTGFKAGNDGTATGTTVYRSGRVFFETARVTAGEEKLTDGAGAVETGASGSAKQSGPKETGASSTMKTTGSAASSGATPSETGAEETGSSTGSAVARLGVGMLAVAGAAAMYAL